MVWPKIKWVDGVLILGLILLLAGLGLSVRGEEEEIIINKGGYGNPQGGNGIPPIQQDIESDNKVKIDVAGEVKRAGVYSLERGARVEDALRAAGGLGEEADGEWVEVNINKAKILMDGEKIYIPRSGEVAVVLGETSSGLISINSGDAAELDKLEGIGPALAGRIIDYREANGGFKDINELKLVSGIGDKLFERIKDKVGL